MSDLVGLKHSTFVMSHILGISTRLLSAGSSQCPDLHRQSASSQFQSTGDVKKHPVPTSASSFSDRNGYSGRIHLLPDLLQQSQPSPPSSCPSTPSSTSSCHSSPALSPLATPDRLPCPMEVCQCTRLSWLINILDNFPL